MAKNSGPIICLVHAELALICPAYAAVWPGGREGEGQGLEIPDPEHIDYIKQEVRSVINSTVALHCGTAMPTLFIWVFSKTESDSNEAIAYNYGLGPKTLPLADTLGDPFLAANTSSLLIMRIKAEAGGFYTCQALYDTEKGPRVTFYYTRLSLQAQQSPA
ncbi:hypothetical protein Baya_11913 [Bagarius yarrelli]|uniref:Ig-like domain-containing protein n=1 Tax=Bagarius yarrelli TaxID=175774 RepID=A0A556V279_BAGYA|nr:hypothetical protein Baya_11913 [Bagarius yarrelli]